MNFEFSTIDQKMGLYKLSGNLIGETDGMSVIEDFSNHIEKGILNFVIDLEQLQHINSSGLGVFITLLTKARKKGGDVNMANPSDYIKNLMLITKLNTIFTIHASVDEAIKDLNQNQ